MASIAPPPPPAFDSRDFSALYNTPIPVSRQKEFDRWVEENKKKGKDVLRDRYDYDVNGLFLSGSGTDDRGHSTDRFKKPNHPTFSTESMYHGQGGNLGGSWKLVNGKMFYEPSATNLHYYNPEELQRYFQQTEPNVVLLARPTLPIPQGLR